MQGLIGWAYITPPRGTSIRENRLTVPEFRSWHCPWRSAIWLGADSPRPKSFSEPAWRVRHGSSLFLRPSLYAWRSLCRNRRLIRIKADALRLRQSLQRRGHIGKLERPALFFRTCRNFVPQLRIRIDLSPGTALARIIFVAQDNTPGGRIVRTIGIVRARAKIGLQDLDYNIRRLVVLEPVAAA